MRILVLISFVSFPVIAVFANSGFLFIPNTAIYTQDLINQEPKNGLVLVVHSANPIASLTQKQVIDIYMGRFQTFPNDTPVKPIDFPQGSMQKQTFYKLLVDKSERKIKAYWSRLLFSGRATPPKELESKVHVISELMINKNALAYINEQDVTAEMKIVYRL